MGGTQAPVRMSAFSAALSNALSYAAAKGVNSTPTVRLCIRQPRVKRGLLTCMRRRRQPFPPALPSASEAQYSRMESGAPCTTSMWPGVAHEPAGSHRTSATGWCG